MSAKFVTIGSTSTDGTPSQVEIDHFIGLLGSASFEEIAVAKGYYFGVAHYNAAVATDATVDILVKLPAASIVQSVGLGGLASAGGNALLEVYQAPTISADGTTLGVLQVNQLSSRTANFTAFHTPTLSADGTLIFRTFIPGGSGGNAVGGTSSPFQRLMALPNTNYLIRVTNLATTTEAVSMNVNLVEIPTVGA